LKELSKFKFEQSQEIKTLELRIEDLNQQKKNLHAKISEMEKNEDVTKEKLEKISRN